MRNKGFNLPCAALLGLASVLLAASLRGRRTAAALYTRRKRRGRNPRPPAASGALPLILTQARSPSLLCLRRVKGSAGFDANVSYRNGAIRSRHAAQQSCPAGQHKQQAQPSQHHQQAQTKDKWPTTTRSPPPPLIGGTPPCWPRRSSKKKRPPPKPPTPDLTGMPKLKDHVDAWIERVERITRWTCPKETRHKVDVLGAKTREEESKWRAQEIRRRTPAPKVIK